MNGIVKAFAYMMAANIQAIAIILMAVWLGDWLNQNHPVGFNWFLVTIPFGVVAMAHTFYLIIRSLIWQNRSKSGRESEEGKSS